MGDFQYCTKVNKMRLNKVTDFDRLGIRIPQSTTGMLRIREMEVCLIRIQKLRLCPQGVYIVLAPMRKYYQ